MTRSENVAIPATDERFNEPKSAAPTGLVGNHAHDGCDVRRDRSSSTHTLTGATSGALLGAKDETDAGADRELAGQPIRRVLRRRWTRSTLSKEVPAHQRCRIKSANAVNITLIVLAWSAPTDIVARFRYTQKFNVPKTDLIQRRQLRNQSYSRRCSAELQRLSGPR
jgi:hypothetical protein